MKSNWHVSTAAEAIAAAQFARLGFDVSVQYGANQREYDLLVANDDKMMKVSVKGSRDGGWGLTQSFKKGRTYLGAIDYWLGRHGSKTVFCLVQFKDVGLDQMPRVYLATPREIADKLRAGGGGDGNTILHEDYTRGPRAKGAGQREFVPPEWRMTVERAAELLEIISHGES